MSAIVPGFKVTTMTSLELVEFINSQRGEGEAELRHDHFMVKVPKVLGEKAAPNFSGTASYLVNGATRQRDIYTFPKREACLMAMSYSYELQAKVFDRMTELETKPSQPLIPQTLPEALRLAADLADQRNIAQAALAIAAPKADALDRLATPTEGSVGLRIAAKLLQMPEKQFLQFANAKGFIFRNHMSKVWQGYNDKAKAGLVEQKITTIERDDGTTKTVEQVLITRLGLAKLALMLGVSGNDSNMELSA